VGPENFFLFGLNADEVHEVKSRGYRPRDHYEADPELKECLDRIHSGYFSPGNPGLFQPLVNALLDHDPFLLLADYRSYLGCQERVGLAYKDTENWTRLSILNVARIGYFSSDRSIREYCERIWKTAPVSAQIGEAQAE
jgi:starch phosphorylase